MVGFIINNLTAIFSYSIEYNFLWYTTSNTQRVKKYNNNDNIYNNSKKLIVKHITRIAISNISKYRCKLNIKQNKNLSMRYSTDRIHCPIGSVSQRAHTD